MEREEGVKERRRGEMGGGEDRRGRREKRKENRGKRKRGKGKGKGKENLI